MSILSSHGGPGADRGWGPDGPSAWLGRRVALRHRVGERAGRPLLSDAVGRLADGGAEAVVVHTRRGPVRVARSAVVAVRLVPPATPRRASWAAVARLEGLCADAWPAQVDVALGAWRLRAAGGYTARANSVLAIGDAACPVPTALDAVRAFAAEHGVPPRVLVPVGSPWGRAVTAAGWRLAAGQAAGAVLVGEAAGPAVEPGTPNPVELLDRPDPRWWDLALDSAPSPAQRHVLDPVGRPTTAFGLVPEAGVLRGAVVDGHLHLSGLRVRPRARRRGYATALIATMAAWGRGRGARWVVLQVASQDSAARQLATGLGCVEHHGYHYLVPPDDA